MTTRYEIVRSSDAPPLVLIFLEGGWEGLPFEIRLLRPWYQSEFGDQDSLTANQRVDIAMQGYCMTVALTRCRPRRIPARSDHAARDGGRRPLTVELDTLERHQQTRARDG